MAIEIKVPDIGQMKLKSPRFWSKWATKLKLNSL
ncbi:Uncharacterised protein [Salmonella enterica subsp. enterica]|uniref:Uncharacterized protein n=1 Tax=Salmonella enterica I TaxID=59201 RepID=A0A379V0S9_SALET|nr:Uncharacterised protein [Salmonella enterica subsp. enterica]